MGEQKEKGETLRDGGFRFRHAFLIILVLLLVLALFSHRAGDLSVLEGGSNQPLLNWIGPAGAHTARLLLYLFGVAAYPLILFLIVCALRPLLSMPTNRRGYAGALIAVVLGLTVLFAMWPEEFIGITEYLGIGHGDAASSALSGGVIGQKLAAPVSSPAAGIIRGTIGTIGTCVVALVLLGTGGVFIWLADWQDIWLAWRKRRSERSRVHSEKPDREELREELRKRREERLRQQEQESSVPEPEPVQQVVVPPLAKESKSHSESGSRSSSAASRPAIADYRLPPLKLLENVKVGSGESNDFVAENQEILQATLDSFGIEATVTGAVSGPRVTRYEISPEPGVKVEKISGLSNNIAMDLQAKSIRVLAPIPGKNAVGVEVPNRTTRVVTLKNIMETDAWQHAKMEIPVILGQDVSGNVVVLDLAKAPHLLIAGATGSGKSVCINALLMSLLYKFTPDDLHLVLVDPKVVEFEVYKTVPHLITEVVNDPKKVPRALRWAINEMERRYRLLAKCGVRNLSTFNQRPTARGGDTDDDGNAIPDRLPVIIIIIDELADIMMIAKAEVETYIARIAQKARAVGIHMVLATQTPRKDIITGVIKANLPTRIAFQVRSIVDSRVILDQKGAESLLGRGDMLYIPPGSANLERLQGPMVFDKEIIEVVAFCAAQMEQRFIEGVVSESDEDGGADGSVGGSASGDDGGGGIDMSMISPNISRFLEPDDDDNFAKALEIVFAEGKASTSYIQRRLKIGYNRAADIIDTMEERGIIGPQPSSGTSREILVDIEDAG